MRRAGPDIILIYPEIILIQTLSTGCVHLSTRYATKTGVDGEVGDPVARYLSEDERPSVGGRRAGEQLDAVSAGAYCSEVPVKAIARGAPDARSESDKKLNLDGMEHKADAVNIVVI